MISYASEETRKPFIRNPAKLITKYFLKEFIIFQKFDQLQGYHYVLDVINPFFLVKKQSVL
ncbi:hypothetical protein C6501_14145 [Candidatus Poribacteria bacterium]|nr:MAG: hypothetical protein C6501_14145 [Candidatus Poribacteria bacterium]